MITRHNAFVKPRPALAALLALGVICSLPAAAEENGFTLTPMVGHLFLGGDSSLEDSSSASLAMGYKFTNPWAVELAYLNSSVGVKNTSDSLTLEQLRIDGLYYFTGDDNIRPFALIGAGQSDFEDDTDAMLNTGMGLKYAFNDLLALRGDVRLIHNVDSDVNHIGFNLGAQFLFGGSSKAMKPKAVIRDTDNDMDGVLDRVDTCLNTPMGVKVDSMGCAINTDLDGDGVVNSVDECPQTKAGAKVDEKGCKLMLAEDVSIALNVNFANNSEQIVSGEEQIESLAEFMTQYPDTTVTVEGHTDSLGAENYNQVLSQKRAEAVSEVLSSRFGIDSARIEALGYGEAKPIATNETREGRAQNRRVSALVKTTVVKAAE